MCDGQKQINVLFIKVNRLFIMAKFAHRRKQELSYHPRYNSAQPATSANDAEVITEAEDNKVKNQKEMTTMEKVELANQILGDSGKVKRIKKDRSLIERAESTKTILMEDNRELLVD